jgi:hypothetical protein
VPRRQEGRPAAIFYPFGHPTLYAYALTCLDCELQGCAGPEFGQLQNQEILGSLFVALVALVEDADRLLLEVSGKIKGSRNELENRI